MAEKLVNGSHSVMLSPDCKDAPATMATKMMPITFCASLPPCAKLNAAEDTSCSFLNHHSATDGLARLDRLIMISVIITAMIIPTAGANTINEMIFKVAFRLIAQITLSPKIKACVIPKSEEHRGGKEGVSTV